MQKILLYTLIYVCTNTTTLKNKKKNKKKIIKNNAKIKLGATLLLLNNFSPISRSVNTVPTKLYEWFKSFANTLIKLN